MPRLLSFALLVACCAAPLAGTAAAQEAAPADANPPAERITFDEAVRLALDRSVALRQAEVLAESRSLDVARQRSLLLPSVSASATPVRRFGLVFDQTTGQLRNETNESLDLGLRGNLNLFNGFADVARLDEARTRARAEQLDLGRSREQVLFDVSSAYLQLLLDRELVGIQRENLTAEDEQLARVEALVEGGSRPRSDVFGQRAAVAERRLAVLQAENAVQLSESRLVQLLQLDPFGTYAFAAPAADDLPVSDETYAANALLAEALGARADIAAQELRIDAADAAVRAAASGYYPSVDLFANYGSAYSSLAARPVPDSGGEIPVTTASGEDVLVGGQPFTLTTPGAFEDVAFADQLSDNRGGSFGLSIQIPIFDRFVTRSQVQQARLERENARLQLDVLRQQVAADVRQAVLDYENARARLGVSAAQIEAAQAALDAEQLRYDLGASTLVELSQARARLVEAQSARAQALFEFFFRARLIDYALGRLDPSQPLFD